MSPKTIVFIGRSGCGKGTQARLISEYLKAEDTEKREIFYVETGAQFRKFIQGDSWTSRRSKEIYARNERQPDFLAIWMWSHLFVENLTGEEHLLIDGTPRSLSEANVLNNALGFYNRPAHIFHLGVSRAWAEHQLLARGRSDDKDMGQITKRLDWFEKDVEPAIEYLKNHTKNNFFDINGEQSIEKVHADIMTALNIPK